MILKLTLKNRFGPSCNRILFIDALWHNSSLIILNTLLCFVFKV